MFPIFTALAAFTLTVIWSPEWSTPWFNAKASMFGVAGLAVLQVLCGAAYGRELHSMRSGEPEDVRVRRLVRADNAYHVLALVFHGAAVFNLNWPRVVSETWRLRELPFVSYAAQLLPYLLFLAATAAGFSRTIRDENHRGLFRRFAREEFTTAAIVLVPALLLAGGLQLVALNQALRTYLVAVPFAAVGILGVLMALVLFTAPSWLPPLLGAKPFPDSPLRTDLLRLCERGGIAPPSLWIKKTQELVNAMVLGVRSRGRAVIFTSSMVDTLSADELGAVLAHELGHVRWRHSAFYGVLGIAALCAVATANALASGLDSELAKTGVLAGTALGIALLFGAYYRRFERQADLFAARLVPANIFIATLEKSARAEGNTRKVWSFTHTSVEQRVNFLLEAGVRPESAAIFERNLSRFVFAGVLFAAFAVGAGFWTAARQVREAPRERARIEAEETAADAKAAWEKGDRDTALAKAETAAKGDAKWELLLGDLLYEAGRVVEAKPHFFAARDRWREGSEEREQLEKRLEEIRQMEERHKDE